MINHRLPQYIAEFIGTFFMVFFGCGSMVLAQVNPSFAGSSIPIIWGGVVSIMIYAVGHISGAHFNPAVTLAFWLTRKFPLKRLPGYVFSQTLGAIVASGLIQFIWGGAHDFGATYMSVPLLQGFVVEVLLSFALMFVITSVATDTRAVGELAGLAIGSTVALAAFVGGPLTKASMNPARSLGPAVMIGEVSSVWPYLIAPCVGTVLGAITYEWIRCHREDDDSKHGCC